MKLPYGEKEYTGIKVGYRNLYGNEKGCAGAYRFGFNGQEKDNEIANGIYTAKFWEYDSRIVRRWNLDPKPTIGISDYSVMAGNPILNSDVDGDSNSSTHTDQNGKVVAVKNDGNLGVYKHTQADIASGNLKNDLDKQVGVTLYEKSFRKGDKIDFTSNRAKDWLNSFEKNQEFMIGLQPTGFLRKGSYAINAKNGSAFDPKSYLDGGIGGGSQISNGVYVSNRDLGNYAAGAFARINAYDKQNYLAETGAFQLSGNNLLKFVSNYSSFLKLAYSHKPIDGAFQRTYGEDDRSNYFIRLGYENIRTLEQLNSNFTRIFYNDKRNYKTDGSDK